MNHPLIGSTRLAEVVTLVHTALAKGKQMPLLAGHQIRGIRLSNGAHPGDACIEVDLLLPIGSLRTYTFDQVESWSGDAIHLIDTFEGQEGPSAITFVPRHERLKLAAVLHELMPVG